MLHTASVQVGAIWFLAVSCMHLKMAIFIPRLPIGLIFHRLLHYVGNAMEMDETFCDLFHILKLKASRKKKKKRFQHEGMALASDSFGCSEQKFRT